MKKNAISTVASISIVVILIRDCRLRSLLCLLFECFHRQSVFQLHARQLHLTFRVLIQILRLPKLLERFL